VVRRERVSSCSGHPHRRPRTPHGHPRARVTRTNEPLTSVYGSKPGYRIASTQVDNRVTAEQCTQHQCHTLHDPGRPAARRGQAGATQQQKVPGRVLLAVTWWFACADRSSRGGPKAGSREGSKGIDDWELGGSPVESSLCVLLIHQVLDSRATGVTFPHAPSGLTWLLHGRQARRGVRRQPGTARIGLTVYVGVRLPEAHHNGKG
jgi:hypothetical protein